MPGGWLRWRASRISRVLCCGFFFFPFSSAGWLLWGLCLFLRKPYSFFFSSSDLSLLAVWYRTPAPRWAMRTAVQKTRWVRQRWPFPASPEQTLQKWVSPPAYPTFFSCSRLHSYLSVINGNWRWRFVWSVFPLATTLLHGTGCWWLLPGATDRSCGGSPWGQRGWSIPFPNQGAGGQLGVTRGQPAAAPASCWGGWARMSAWGSMAAVEQDTDILRRCWGKWDGIWAMGRTGRSPRSQVMSVVPSEHWEMYTRFTLIRRWCTLVCVDLFLNTWNEGNPYAMASGVQLHWKLLFWYKLEQML